MSTFLLDTGQLTNILQTILFVGGIVAGAVSGIALILGVD
jgi:hypothetical protein